MNQLQIDALIVAGVVFVVSLGFLLGMRGIFRRLFPAVSNPLNDEALPLLPLEFRLSGKALLNMFVLGAVCILLTYPHVIAGHPIEHPNSRDNLATETIAFAIGLLLMGFAVRWATNNRPYLTITQEGIAKNKNFTAWRDIRTIEPYDMPVGSALSRASVPMIRLILKDSARSEKNEITFTAKPNGVDPQKLLSWLQQYQKKYGSVA